jgi:hypothetical protein
MLEETKYCTFIDVLGYGEIVKDETTSFEQKAKALNSIYSSIAANFPLAINEINANVDDRIFMRSFSDCFYLECGKIEPLLIALNRIFNWTFGYFSNFSLEEERTPLLRAGIVKDWTLLFKDIGAMANNKTELNPVGPGVARAYWTSEKSNLSGMRIIISPEVFHDLGAKERLDKEVACFGMDVKEGNGSQPYFFKYLSVDEKHNQTNLYEMIWSFQGMNDCTSDYTSQLEKIRPTFTKPAERHFIQTAKVLLTGLLLSDCEKRTETLFNNQKRKLESFIQGAETLS